MSDFDSNEVDWGKVRRNLNQANNNLQVAEREIAQGFDEGIDGGDLPRLIHNADAIPHNVDELCKGVTTASSYLRNGTLNYIP